MLAIQYILRTAVHLVPSNSKCMGRHSGRSRSRWNEQGGYQLTGTDTCIYSGWFGFKFHRLSRFQNILMKAINLAPPVSPTLSHSGVKLRPRPKAEVTWIMALESNGVIGY